MAENKWIDEVKRNYMTVYEVNTVLYITSIEDTIILDPDSPALIHYFKTDEPNTITVTKPDGQIVTVADEVDTSGSIKLDQSGTYTVRYSGTNAQLNNNTDIPLYSDYSIAFQITAVANVAPLPRWTIASVIERALDIAETHLEGVPPRFHLNAKQAEEFSKIEAPEFAFTNSTLKEILDQIGGYIHGIPRLKGNEIYFDMLGGTEECELSKRKILYVSNLYGQDIESYCTSLDSTVDNLVCLTDPEQGTIVEPYYDGYKTLRTETVYARIEEDNMFIATQFPIQEIKSVKFLFPLPNPIGENSADITPFVFEEADYNRMDGYTITYPLSKAYAIYYTQGQKNIYGLNFKIPKAIGEAYEKYSIIRILEEKGIIFGSEIIYPLLAFQVSYIPIFSARIQQTKSYIGDVKQPRSLVYNQGANLVETRYYGENLKGTVARMGNVERVITYNFDDLSLIPKVGQMFEDYYVVGVTVAVYSHFVKCMVSLSKDFNRLSKYIGINSTQRFYEVSEKQAYRRNVKYGDYVVIGDEVVQDETLATIEPIRQTLVQSDKQHSVSSAVAQGFDEDGNPLTQVCLPVISTAQGNAMIFTFNYEDNYSAGANSVYVSETQVRGYFTNSVGYTDYYGRIDTLNFKLFSEIPQTDPFRQVIIGGNLPAWKGESDSIEPQVATTTPLKIRKDNREILSLNYALEFVTNKRNYIIGSALARNCPLVRGTDSNRSTSLYILPNRLGKFASRVSLDGAVKVADYSEGGITIDGKRLKLEDITSTADGAAWAIVDGSGELLLGSNETITAGQTVVMPYMTLRHNIFNL